MANQNPNISYDGLTINATREVGSVTETILHYNKNLDTITKITESTDVITRLIGHGEDGLTIEGLDVTSYTDAQLVGVHYKLENGKKIVTQRYIDSTRLNDYALPKEGIKDFEVTDQMDLFKKMMNYLPTIDYPTVSYEVSFLEFSKQGIPFSDVNLGDVITVVDESVGISERLRVVELNKNPIKAELSTCTLAAKRANIVDFFSELDSIKNTITESNSSNSEIFKELQDRLQEIGDILNGKESKIIYDADAIYVINKDTLGVNDEITNHTHLLKLSAGALGCSTNGGHTYSTAVDAKGVAADQIIGNAVVGVLGRFERISVKNTVGKDTCIIGRFKSQVTGEDTFGIQIEGGAFEIVGGLKNDQVSDDFFDDIIKDIDDLNSSFQNMDNIINNAFSDEKLTSLEANELKSGLSYFISESADIIAKATTLKIVTERDAYDNAIRDYKEYLEKYWLSGSFPKDITNSDREIIQIKKNLIGSSKSILLNAISAAVEDASKQFVINYVNKQMGEVNSSFEDLNDKFDILANDLVVTAMEAESYKKSIEEFKKESEDVVKEAKDLNIVSELNNYQQAINNYETYVNNKFTTGHYPQSVTIEQVNQVKYLSSLIFKCKSILFNKINDEKLNVSNKIAQEAIDKIKDSLNDFEDNIHDILFDGQMTQVEANLLKTNMLTLSEQALTLINAATGLNLENEIDIYESAYNDLKTYMNTYWFDKNYPLSISKTQREAINTKFAAVSQSITELSNAIINKQNNITKEYVDRNLDELTSAMDEYGDALNDFMADNNFTAQEARILENQLQQIVYESMDIINMANNLGITTLKDNYKQKLQDLQDYMYSNYLGKSYPIKITENNRLEILEKYRQVQYVKGQLENQINVEYTQQNAVILDKNYNGVNINYKDGIIIQRGDAKVRTILNATSGISIQRKENSSWINQLYADTEGKLQVKDLVAKNILLNGGVLKDNEGNTLIDLANKIIDFSKFETIYGKLKAKFIETEELLVQAGNIRGKITAGQLDIKGLQITDNKNRVTFKIDNGGNVTLGGNIIWGTNAKPTYTAAEIGALPSTWQPKYADILGTKPSINADNTFLELQRNSNIKGFVYQNGSLYLNADDIRAGSISADRITGGTLQGVTIRTGDPYQSGQFINMQKQYLDFINNGYSKLSIGFMGISGSRSTDPYITFGVGDGSGGNNTGYMYKTSGGFYVGYHDSVGKTHQIAFTSSGTVKVTGNWDFSGATVKGLSGGASSASTMIFD